MHLTFGQTIQARLHPGGMPDGTSVIPPQPLPKPVLPFLQPLSSLRHPVATPLTESQYPRSLHQHRASPSQKSIFMGGVVSPVLLPLQQAPTCRVPPLPTQYVFNLNPNSIYYADGSITSHIKYGALVFCFLLSELLSSWTHPLRLLFPWHPRSTRSYQRGGVRSCVFGARSRFPPDLASRQIRRGDPAKMSTHTHARVCPACA